MPALLAQGTVAVGSVPSSCRGAVDKLCDSLYSRAKSTIWLRQLVEFKCLCGHDPGLCLDPLETPRGVLAENRTHAVFALRGYVRRIKEEDVHMWCATQC